MSENEPVDFFKKFMYGAKEYLPFLKIAVFFPTVFWHYSSTIAYLMVWNTWPHLALCQQVPLSEVCHRNVCFHVCKNLSLSENVSVDLKMPMVCHSS